MKLELFKTLWGHDGDIDSAIALTLAADFQGIEAPLPADAESASHFLAALSTAGLHWIAEVSTCTTPGKYVPNPGHSVAEHLDSLDSGIRHSLAGKPLFINTMASSDAWSHEDALAFFCGVLDLEQTHGIAISCETHRGRYTHNPWLFGRILRALPELKITADFSHWCVVTERLILDEEPVLLELACAHAYHLQTRVGYAQGPQVPDPRAPEYADALSAHERWWDCLWQSQRARSLTRSTLTPEFGPDGYLHCAPFTQEPVADLWDINQWIAHRQRDRFQNLTSSSLT